jgi:flagellar motor switch protein FliN
MTDKPEFDNVASISSSTDGPMGNMGPSPDSPAMRMASEKAVSNIARAIGRDAVAEMEKSGNLSMLMGVHLSLTVELGRTNLSVRQVLELQKGTVVELDRIAGEAVDIYVNDRLIARGDVVVVDDKFGVRITELVSPNEEE